MSADLQTRTLAGSICIRCGHEPLETEDGEWWCLECFEGGWIHAPRPIEKPDALLSACRAIVDVQRSQLRARRAGESLGEASILGALVRDGVLTDASDIEDLERSRAIMDEQPPKWDDSEPGRPTQTLDELIAEWDEETGRGFQPLASHLWIAERHPEIDWLVHLADRTAFQHSNMQLGLRRAFPEVTEPVWRTLLG